MTSKTAQKARKCKTRDILERKIKEDLVRTQEETNHIQVIGSKDDKN